MFNQDLTIVNKKFNTTTKLEEYKLYYVKGYFSSKQGITINNTQLTSNDMYEARILLSETGYVTPSVYQSLTSVTGKWTLQNDDYVVKGKVSSVTTIAVLKSTYSECFKIKNVAVKDYCSTNMKHYSISGE